MKKLLLLLTIVAHASSYCMSAAEVAAEREEVNARIRTRIAALHQQQAQERAEFTPKLLTPIALAELLPDYETSEASPWLNNALVPQQNAQNLLAAVMTFWLDPNLVFPTAMERSFPEEIDAHYIAIRKAILNGAQPENPADLEGTLQKIYRHADREFTRWQQLRNCYAACRALVLPDLQDPDPTAHWPRHWKKKVVAGGVVLE